jgi:protein involved in polysaccharide export with SLBB domain
MHAVKLRPLLVAALVSIAPPVVAAAQRPSSSEAAALLQARPDLVNQLRERIMSSGMTPDQIRARLRAEGYPENLLDAYLTGTGYETESTSASSGDVLSAMSALGIADSSELSGLTGPEATDAERTNRLGRVPLPFSCDSMRVEGDSLVSLARDPRCASVARPAAYAADGSTLFGLDVFRRGTSQFEPNLAGPVDASYRLGPGDRLVLILTGDVELAHQLNVTREGFVLVPQVGQIFVANLTLEQLEDVLYSRLGRVYSGVRRGPGATTRFSVSVSRLRSNQVYVLGDVTNPGAYRISSAGTVLTALYAAGGPTENGSLRTVEVRRAGGKVASTLDVYDYLLRGDASRDVRLETGDVIFIPVHGPRVRVVGEVVRPATYELKPGEQLADVLRAAGGLTEAAAQRRVQIERIVPAAQRTAPGHDRVVIDISSEGFADGNAPAFAMQPGDVVRVFPISTRVRNRVTVVGNVWSPGVQGYKPGMMLSDALKGAGGLKPDVYLGQVLVTRLRPDSTPIQLRAQLRDTTGAVVGDLALKEDDEIHVFSASEFRPARYVAITGAVREGGRFPYREGMTVRDLVLLAGGLQESAYLGEAEIARLPEDRANGVTARTIRVPLDSSYLFERGPDGHYLGPPGLPATNGSAPEAELRPYDNVLILRQPDWSLQRTVYLGGEVRFPGRYALLNKSERLTQLIARAGGLTSEAYAEGVFFIRPQNNLGRIGIDLPAALKNRRSRDNLLLVDGDSITIPPYNAVVNVKGAVNSPVAVAYVPDQDLDYYIAAAGGPNRRADTKRAFVTQPSGKVESRRALRQPKPRAGSTVNVPEKEAADNRSILASLSTSVQILSAIVAIVLATRR